MKALLRPYLLVPLTVSLLAGGAVLARSSEDRAPVQSAYFFGTLRTDPDKARLEHRNGIDVAHMTIRWEQFEPKDGVYDAVYVNEVKREVRTLQQAGDRIEVGIGINHVPTWLYQRYPKEAFTDEHGDHYKDTANIVFSQKIRDQVRRYMAVLNQKVGLNNFWAIRMGVNDNGEFTYPSPVPDDRRPGPDYWAFDIDAQQTAPPGHRAITVPRNPFPGWRPGQREYRGKPFTRLQAARWYDWYLGSLADAVNWQKRTYRWLGYDGLLKVLVPGTGYYPSDYATAVRDYFTGPHVSELVGLGAGFFRTIPMIKPGSNMQIVATSLVNGTGTPQANPCRPADSATNLLSVNDAGVRRWSSVRWVSAIARQAGFAVSGESAGPQVHRYYPGVMDDAARQMRSCHLKGLMWAFDANLYDGTPGSSLGDYAAMVRRTS